MSKWFLAPAVAVVLLAGSPSAAKAQNIQLTNADPIWRGTSNSFAGLWMDQGAVSDGDSRPDLIVGAPGSGVLGRVYIIFGGPSRSGSLNLSAADAIITGENAGDRFGAQTAAGNIRNTEGQVPRDLVVGAPGAMSGRGVVYLFSGGFSNGDTIAAAAATYKIVGALGDQLGSALATADLNNDGHREIIIGAPGNDRIYVIRGSAALSGSRTLDPAALLPTDQLIFGGGGAGLGRVMAAGDVTADGISDLLVGVPELSSVYLFRGSAAGSFSAAIDAHFDGAAGERVGEAIRLGDLDSDGVRDLIIGAPNVDGPSSRVDSGAVFVFWGRSTLTTTGASLADVAFYGEAAGQRLGAALTSGDVNRDTPNDLVALAPGAAAGAGQLQVYYGRSRTSFGVSVGSGRRLVDFAAGGIDRRITGDAGVGAMVSLQVFEVTGEGARDIIVAVPTADSNTGLVFFTISPRMRLSSSSLIVRIDENGTAARTVEVRNASSIAIGWQGSSNRPWMSLPVASGSTVVNAPGLVTINFSAVGLPIGTHTGTVTVQSTSNHLEMSLPISVTFVVRKRQARGGDFDGDRSADLTVFRPSNGTWYTRYSSGSSAGYQWGNGNDTPVPGDYDGDGRIDRAVFRPSNGVWYIWYSSTGATAGYQWGNGTDRPLPADYDGDGRTDIAVFRPSIGTWFVLYATGGTYGVQWGNSLDVAVPADYDGDGRADITVFRPSNGTWYVLKSSNGTMTATQWGNGNDVAVPGDYDGDGAVDLAVFRPANGVWYLRYSGTGATAGFQWGNGNDTPVPGDYDGDGRTDIAVFRPSNGVWYLSYSSGGAAGFQWGNGNDVPVLKRP